MATTDTIMIPGRRISYGESFYSDWGPRTGDSMILSAQCMLVSGGGSVELVVETRAEPGSSITTPVAPTYVPAGSVLTLSAAGVVTGYWRATASGLLQAQVRLKVQFSGGSTGNYLVVRVFRPIFFDGARSVWS